LLYQFSYCHVKTVSHQFVDLTNPVDIRRWSVPIFTVGALSSGLWHQGGKEALLDVRSDKVKDFNRKNAIDRRDRGWAGKLTLVAMYKHALTANEVKANFGAGPTAH